MTLISIDTEKCKQDGICIDECPVKILHMKGTDSFPEVIAGGSEICIGCGHCVAVCPHGALSHKRMTPEQCPDVREAWRLDPERVEHFLRHRRSIRTYKQEAVEKDRLTRLIDMARYAPSGHNGQPVRWLILYESDTVRKLAGMVIDWMKHILDKKPAIAKTMDLDRVIAEWDSGYDIICRNAPHMILTLAKKSDRTAQPASTLALSYLELAASSMDLGACWAGYFIAAASLWAPMKEVLGLPEGHAVFGAMMVGYPKYTYRRLPLRNAAKVTWK